MKQSKLIEYVYVSRYDTSDAPDGVTQSVYLPPRMDQAELHSYVKRHAELEPGATTMYQLHEDMHVFKQVFAEVKKAVYDTREERWLGLAVANLVIPAGARVNLPPTGLLPNDNHVHKMRASKARVHSIWRYAYAPSSAEHALAVREVDEAWSTYDFQFVYRKGAEVAPDHFDMRASTCAAGIHFFADLRRAIFY